MITRKARRVEVTEAITTVVDTGDLRRAISALSAAANIAAEAMRVNDKGDRDRGRAVIDQCTAGLAALAFSQIPKVRR